MARHWNPNWPVLKSYDIEHLARIALPVGGLGTGTLSLGGRGDLRDWEIVNRPAKGFVPRDAHGTRANTPSFVLRTHGAGGSTACRLLEGPLDSHDYEGAIGSPVPTAGLPRFRRCEFAAAYPFGQVHLSDPDLPCDARIESFNPLIPGDADRSGLPVAILRFVITNTSDSKLTVSVCGSLPNFIGTDGSIRTPCWDGTPLATGACKNRNQWRIGRKVRGISMHSEGVAPEAEAWGTLALTTTAKRGISWRTAWADRSWGDALLDFWDDFSEDGKVDERKHSRSDSPMASLAVRFSIPPRQSRAVTFLVTWHFPNRMTWTPAPAEGCGCQDGACEPADNRIGNYYTDRFADAWEVAEKVAEELPSLEESTRRFVSAFIESDLPKELREAALFNLSTLRSQSCFRTPDGYFYGWEGCHDSAGCCPGSCTHVWNYEQATPFLFGELARSMREVEFAHATDEQGMISFRVNLPLSRAREMGKAAADGQLGCIMKLYREWQLSGDEAMLSRLWSAARRALEFCWIEGGWDGDEDGVMEGCQHNTMDVEYYGPNPQMQGWYLGALRAGAAMAEYLGESDFAEHCRSLAAAGSAWMDAHLFNGEYYEQEIRPPADPGSIPAALAHSMGARDPAHPELQLGAGCLIDQLVGQYMAHICDLGYLHDPHMVRRTLRSIVQYNRRAEFHSHFNHLRSFVLGDESGILMASYPKGNRPERPFPYYNEVMTGFEYTLAAHLIYEGKLKKGLKVIAAVRQRYDGRKRNPFNEAECGHHYARAMASWAGVLAFTGFHYSAVTQTMSFADREGNWFWSNGDAWGMCHIKNSRNSWKVRLSVYHGELTLNAFGIHGKGETIFPTTRKITAVETITFRLER